VPRLDVCRATRSGCTAVVVSLGKLDIPLDEPHKPNLGLLIRRRERTESVSWPMGPPPIRWEQRRLSAGPRGVRIQARGRLPSVRSYPSFHRVSLDDRNRAELQHTFTSKAVAPSDVAYVFPLPPDASVYAFRALIDEQLVEGVVMEKAEARATFESAVAMNQKAALLQQENVEIFRLMLGNVAPGQTVVVS
jgi:hypothetical protein